MPVCKCGGTHTRHIIRNGLCVLPPAAAVHAARAGVSAKPNRQNLYDCDRCQATNIKKSHYYSYHRKKLCAQRPTLHRVDDDDEFGEHGWGGLDDDNPEVQQISAEVPLHILDEDVAQMIPHLPIPARSVMPVEIMAQRSRAH